MKNTTLVSFLAAFIIPIMLYWIFEIKIRCKKRYRIIILLLYVLFILYETLFNRVSGGEKKINLIPFWSYAYWNKPEYRWQIYMNIFLFIPFGYILAWVLNREFWKTLLLGIFLSIAIEVSQYHYALGLCEFDDIFHNTIGTAIGYLYWRFTDRYLEYILSFIKHKIKEMRHK